MATNPSQILIGAGVYSTDATTTQANAFFSVGGYREGVEIRFSEDRYNLEIADALCYVASVRTRLDCNVQTELVEASFESLATAIGILPANMVTGSSTTQDLIIDQPNISAHKFVGTNAVAGQSPDLKTWIFSRAVPQVDTAISYQKNGETLVPINFLVLGTYDASNSRYSFGSVSNA